MGLIWLKTHERLGARQSNIMKKFKFNSPEVIKKKIRSVAVQMSPSCDGGILATIMRLIYYHGLKIGEFNILKIGDVLDRGEIAYRFKSPYQPYFTLHNDYKILMKCHLDYLKENNYSVVQDAPLFPKLKSNVSKPKSSAYHLRQLRRELKDYANLTWEQLRRDGIYHHYQLLAWQGYSNQDIIIFAAWYFRAPAKKIYTILRQGGITLAGVNLASVVEPQKTEPAPVEATPKVKWRIKRTWQAVGSSRWESLERIYNQMTNEDQRKEDHDRDDNDNEDGTDLSRPVFDPYFFGDGYDD